ncbi:MAG: hypothetical protein CBB71_01715 [Rhodopirellula sp. TMED11]|nr:MAG: hypothetical protein CBB71_01715 [Rhodopirellula sp. TMED11]
MRWWRAVEFAELQGGGIGGFNRRPGRVSLQRPAVGVANHFTLTSLTLDSPASGRVQSTNGPINNILPLAGGSAGLRWRRADEFAELQGGGIGGLNRRPGRVSLQRPAVGVATVLSRGLRHSKR